MTITIVSHIVDQPIAEVISALEAAFTEHHFSILHMHDVQATLAKKGIEHGQYLIVEFCRAPAAKQLLDHDPELGVFLPCRIAVWETETGVWLAAFRPTAIRQFVPNAELGDLPEEIERDIVAMLESITSHS